MAQVKRKEKPGKRINSNEPTFKNRESTNYINFQILKVMCGIAGILNIKTQTKELRDKALKMAQKIRHRGPDWSGIYVGGSAILAHERLSIVDPQSGGQPLYSPTGNKCSL